MHDSIEATHHSYNELGARYLLDRIAAGKRVGLLVASHNEDSAEAAVQLMRAKNIDPKDGRVHFAQLQGMCDHVSYALHELGVNACKLFPYGPVHEVMPYLVRRMQENQGFMGATARERYLCPSSLTPSLLLASELRRRASGKSDEI